jgi:hypothetical protein
MAAQWEDAACRRITEAQARRVLSDIHEQIHGERLASPSVIEYVVQWLGRKKGETAAVWSVTTSGEHVARNRIVLKNWHLAVSNE